MNDDDMILRIKRKYTKNEEVGIILQRLSEREIEIGILKSDVARLKYEIVDYKYQIDKQKRRIETLQFYNKQLKKK